MENQPIISDRVRKIFIAAALLLGAVLIWVNITYMTKENPKPADKSEPTETAEAPELELPPESITVECSTRYMAVGFSTGLTVSGTSRELRYFSSDPDVLSVDGSGNMTAQSVGRATVFVTGDNVEPASFSVTVVRPGVVCLSPSRQTGNPYAAGDTNEGEQMHLVAYRCEEVLKAAGLEIYMPPDNIDLEYRGKRAKENNAICYVAIHSNAGGDRIGTSAYYHNKIPDSAALALYVFYEVAALTPTDDPLGVVNGMAKDNGFGYKEIRFPGIEGIPSTLVELEFHDKPEQAQWIIDNVEPLGDAVAEGILKYLAR